MILRKIPRAKFSPRSKDFMFPLIHHQDKAIRSREDNPRIVVRVSADNVGEDLSFNSLFTSLNDSRDRHPACSDTRNLARKHNPTQLQRPIKNEDREVAEARRLLEIVEKSQVPFGQSADLYAGLKSKIESGRLLTKEDFENLRNLVKIAQEWEKGVETSAQTEREETMAG